jgi:hypothetical protein
VPNHAGGRTCKRCINASMTDSRHRHNPRLRASSRVPYSRSAGRPVWSEMCFTADAACAPIPRTEYSGAYKLLANAAIDDIRRISFEALQRHSMLRVGRRCWMSGEFDFGRIVFTASTHEDDDKH